jgi:hypothetical protein
MEFKYRVSEAEYLNAWKVRREGLAGPRVVRRVMFWVFIFVCLMLVWICLMLVWAVVNQKAQVPVEPAPVTSSVPQAILVDVLPFVAILGVWVLMLVRLGPGSLRRMYRKDPAMQGVYSVEITPESISFTNTAGIATRTGWNIYESWREGRNLIVLIYHSSAYFTLVLSGLSETERSELRGILAAAIPRP